MGEAEVLFVAERPELVPRRQSALAAGFDLCAKDAVHIEPGESAMVGTGVRMAIPPGYVGLVRPRSGLASRRGIITRSSDAIDPDYRGEVVVVLWNTSHERFAADAGYRVAQILFLQTLVASRVVDELPETDRGVGGFGHTGG